MAARLWKEVSGCSNQPLLNKFFDLSSCFMYTTEKLKKWGEKEEKENNDGNTGHFVIAS